MNRIKRIIRIYRKDLVDIWSRGDYAWYEKCLLTLAMVGPILSGSNLFLSESGDAYSKKMDAYIAFWIIALPAILFLWSPSIVLYGRHHASWNYRIAWFLAAYRVFDIVSYRVYFVFVKSRRAPWDRVRRSLFIAFLNFCEIVTAFAILYILSAAIAGNNGTLCEPRSALYFSLVTITTLGYGDFTPIPEGQWIVVFELLTGLLFLGLIVPALVSAFAELAAPTVAPFNGLPRRASANPDPAAPH